MKPTELREMDSQELNSRLEELRARLYQLRAEFHTDEEPDTSEKMKIRKDIARILTILKERELELKL